MDNNGAETTSAPRSVTVSGTNAAPTVSLSAPEDNARYLSPSSITLSANATGPELNDLLQKVEFFVNGALAGTVTSAPWSFSWQNPALGTYTLTAVATDSQGTQTTSAARTVVVTDQNQAPAVSIVTPLDNSRWHSPASFMFQANASSGEANDIVRVEFYVDGALQGQDTTSPYSINLSSLPAGTYTLMARAVDGQNAHTDSVTRTLTVSDTNAAPTVSLSAPASGANFPAAPANITLSAAAGAGEVNGWVTKVEFYVNGTLVNTDTAGPWSYTVSNLANGSYTLTAKAFDQLNAETLSAPITVTVGPVPKLHFVHVDHLNTPRLVTNELQQAVWRWDQQEPFGVIGPDENPSALGTFEFPLRFPGQYADQENNLFYNYFRDYEPAIGRYIQADPVGLSIGVPAKASRLNHLYAYAKLVPQRLSDPFGLAPGDRFGSEAEAAADALAYAWPPTVQTGWEHGGWIFQNPDCSWEYTFGTSGSPETITYGPMPPGTTADYHTHPPQSPPTRNPGFFSRDRDIPGMTADRTRGYVAVPPNGQTLVYTPPDVRSPREECRCLNVPQP